MSVSDRGAARNETTRRCGDRVWAHYHEHSIPTRSLGTIVGVGVKYVTVKLDPPATTEVGDRVCVPWQSIEPESGWDAPA